MPSQFNLTETCFKYTAVIKSAVVRHDCSAAMSVTECSPLHVLVTGGSGLLGRQVVAVLAGAGLEVTATCHSRPGPGLTCLDLTDPPAVADLLRNVRPTHLIHAAAQRFPDKESGTQNDILSYVSEGSALI